MFDVNDTDRWRIVNSKLNDVCESLSDWRGTAAELANECNALIPLCPSLAGDAGAANERLVRHYVQVGVLTPPERERREALFGVRQVVEFLAARYLLNDGWPLAKVGEIVRATDVPGLLELIPAERTPTRAEETVARYRRESKAASSPSVAAVRALQMTSTAGAAPADLKTSFRVSDLRSTRSRYSTPAVKAPATPVERAAEISRRRVALEENLQSLGNRAGRPETRRLLRISLTPWCHVDIEAHHLKAMSDGTPEVLGAALTQALHDERTRRKGERP
jgi:DNA-binding transcriptional MerR regulator